MTRSLYIAECANYGTVALFGSGGGVLLIQGSSWVRCGSRVTRNGFADKAKLDFANNPTVEDKEKLFLQVCGFDLSRGFWSEDVDFYKKKEPFAYKYIMEFDYDTE